MGGGETKRERHQQLGAFVPGKPEVAATPISRVAPRLLFIYSLSFVFFVFLSFFHIVSDLI
jgi:hypothetical protein